MNQRLNDIAIMLTKKIEADLVMLCADITRADEKTVRQAPNFFMVREKILLTLDKYLEVMVVETTSSPLLERSLSAKIIGDIKAHELKHVAHEIVLSLLKRKDCFKLYQTEDEYSRYRNISRELVIVKTGALEESGDKI